MNMQPSTGLERKNIFSLQHCNDTRTYPLNMTFMLTKKLFKTCLLLCLFPFSSLFQRNFECTKMLFRRLPCPIYQTFFHSFIEKILNGEDKLLHNMDGNSSYVLWKSLHENALFSALFIYSLGFETETIEV